MTENTAADDASAVLVQDVLARLIDHTDRVIDDICYLADHLYDEAEVEDGDTPFMKSVRKQISEVTSKADDAIQVTVAILRLLDKIENRI